MKKRCSDPVVGKHVAARVSKEGVDLHLVRGTIQSVRNNEATVFDGMNIRNIHTCDCIGNDFEHFGIFF